ncbi:hypothetical protein [Persephonella sp.]
MPLNSGFLPSKSEAAVYIHKSENLLNEYISYLEKHYPKVIKIDDIDVQKAQKQAEAVINNLSNDEKKFV